jgi:hypothetical protein
VSLAFCTALTLSEAPSRRTARIPTESDGASNRCTARHGTRNVEK